MNTKDTTKNDNDNIRFTTLINPKLLSNIKLISYFTNQKLYETINDSINLYIENFEKINNTSIQSIINLQTKFSNQQNQSTPLNPNKEKDKE